MDQAHSQQKKRILLAPLDWGLGHATRCIPIIRSLAPHAQLILAGEGPVRKLLEAEFPSLPFVEFRGYGVEYSRSRWSLPFVMASQIPKILSAIQYENERLQEIVKEQQIDAIISDNRYGLYHNEIPSVFITHQLLVKTGLGKMADELFRHFHYKQIEKFSACWIPDALHEPWLAGELAHPQKLPSLPCTYLEPLSRMQAMESKEDHLLVLLSGPEPQRTLLENLVMEELENYTGKTILLRGLPEGGNSLPEKDHVTIYDHVSAATLNQLMAEAKCIIARPGYSTVMDIASLGKKSILIPTPGQTEQEYLAQHLMKSNFAFCMEQKKFRLQNLLQLSEHFPYLKWQPTKSSLDQAIAHFLHDLM